MATRASKLRRIIGDARRPRSVAENSRLSLCLHYDPSRGASARGPEHRWTATAPADVSRSNSPSPVLITALQFPARLERYGAGIIRIARALPRDRAGRLIADQLLRSGTAGGSNYEESRSAQSRRDFVHKASLAAKELRESRYWLGVTARTEATLADEALSLRGEGTQLVAILMASIRTARENEGRGTGGRKDRS